jgi:uncharacterized phiE125 gp8 family phage protein
MSLTVVTPAEGDPVTVADAKAFARVVNSAEDALVASLITAATEYIQTATGRQFALATFELTMRSFPCGDGLVRLPRSPLVEVESVKYIGTDGVLVTMTADVDFLVDASAEPATLEPVVRWPVTADRHDAVQIRFTAGYPDTEDSPSVSTMPARAAVAIKALVAHWFENRPAVDVAQTFETPFHVARLISGLRVWGAAR